MEIINVNIMGKNFIFIISYAIIPIIPDAINAFIEETIIFLVPIFPIFCVSL